MNINNLTAHEKKVAALILNSLEGNVQGFPDTDRKFCNVVKAWAKFISLDPYHVELNADYAHYLTPEQIEEEKKPMMWREGIVPGEWLMEQIQDSCEWMPAPIVAREIYIGGGWKPADGKDLDHLASVGRRRADGPEFHPVEFEGAGKE